MRRGQRLRLAYEHEHRLTEHRRVRSAVGVGVGACGAIWSTAADLGRLLGALAQTALILWFVHLVGAWHAMPSPLWTVALIAAAVGLVRVVAWWPRLPPTAGDRIRRIWATVGSFASPIGVADVIVWATA